MSQSIAPATPPHTRSWYAFERNLDEIIHFVAISAREMGHIVSSTKRIGKRFETPRRNQLAERRFMRSLRRYTKNLATRVERFKALKRWQVVMLVTCVEAYLQDVLALAACVDPKLMAKSEQAAVYAEILTATSLEALAEDLRNRWARAWVSDGGPTRWIDRLERMGARGYPDALAARLELFWGIRHTVVHSAGVATQEFVKRHPHATVKIGELVSVSSNDYGLFVDAAKSFLETTESFILARYPEASAIRS